MTTYHQDVSDTVNVSDGKSTQTEYLREPVSIFTITQLASPSTIFYRTLADSLTIAHTTSGGRLMSEIISSNIGLVQSVKVARSLTDTITFSETLAVTAYDVNTESFTMVDMVAVQTAFNRTGLSQTVTVLQYLSGQHFRNGIIYAGIRVKNLSFSGPV